MSTAVAELVGTGQPGTVYLLHFDEPFRHARHYLGWARAGRLQARLATHGKAHGSALMRAVAAAGIGWRLARTWPGDRYLERRLKVQGGHSRKCPICRATDTGQAGLFEPTPEGRVMAAALMTAGEVLRDRWGRYLIPDPATGEVRAWTRATTLAATLADRTVLEAWDQRNVVLGIGARADLYAQAASCTPDDTAVLNGIVDQAKAAAAAQAGANTGSALHRFTERVDAGEHDLVVPEPWDRDIAAYQATLQVHRITVAPGWLERVLVIPDAGAAGTCDRLLCAPGWGRPRIGDLKTGQDIVRYGAGYIAVQLALYAHATHWYDPTTGDLHEITDDVDQDQGLVMHLPAGHGTCDLHDIDIAAGWDAVQLALDVRRWRTRKNLATPTPTPTEAHQ
ncbi:MAG: hypothetical protein ACRD2C_04245 [Acidimicrobiales bacterium]